MFSFQSYCWAMGTTSFRTKEFNLTIELQLKLLSEFWKHHEKEQWSENKTIQEQYYDFLKENDFLSTEPNRKAKDARQKTSGLVELGLIDNERRLTAAGAALLKVEAKYFKKSNNLLQIPADSYIYMKQLLKTTVLRIGKIPVRPYVVLILTLLELKYLSQDEFTYMIPLIDDESKYETIISQIKDYRKGSIQIDNIILNNLMSMPNYKNALDTFLESPKITEDLICIVGMNRKSKKYDLPYYRLYLTLQNLINNPSSPNILAFDKASRQVRIGLYWRNYLYDSAKENKIKKDGLKVLKNVPILHCANEQSYRTAFFKLMHLFKAKATLHDYCDLNKRYFGLTDTILFKDNLIQLDIIPKCYFALYTNLKEIAFKRCDNLDLDVPLEDILEQKGISEQRLYQSLFENYGISVSNADVVRQYIENERLRRFNELVEKKFNDAKLIELFTLFENRKDDSIKDYITDNADTPTLFEYVTAIAWYKISDRQGNILEFMNLSLDADLLPKTHAGGGEEDITYRYSKTKDYPEHTVLIEVTLSESTNQRRMEMEPVSRHLGEYLLSHSKEEVYTLFVTNFLHINVISDFHMRRFVPYYNTTGDGFIEGMDIVPIQTSDLKNILARKMKYPDIYKIFKKALSSSLSPKQWYDEKLKSKFL